MKTKEKKKQKAVNLRLSNEMYQTVSDRADMNLRTVPKEITAVLQGHYGKEAATA